MARPQDMRGYAVCDDPSDVAVPVAEKCPYGGRRQLKRMGGAGRQEGGSCPRRGKGENPQRVAEGLIGEPEPVPVGERVAEDAFLNLRRSANGEAEDETAAEGVTEKAHLFDPASVKSGLEAIEGAGEGPRTG